MAKYTGPKAKLVRRFGSNIIESQKMQQLLERRSESPGQHGGKQQRRRISEYGLQLLEKQKLKYSFGLLEKQFHRTFKRARNQRGVTGDNLLILLESRLDNVIFRAGLSSTRMQARQLINHGHLTVNGRRVDIPSFQVKAEDLIGVKETPRSVQLLCRTQGQARNFGRSSWLEVDREKLRIRVERLPQREDISIDVNEKLIVELYSK